METNSLINWFTSDANYRFCSVPIWATASVILLLAVTLKCLKWQSHVAPPVVGGWVFQKKLEFSFDSLAWDSDRKLWFSSELFAWHLISLFSHHYLLLEPSEMIHTRATWFVPETCLRLGGTDRLSLFQLVGSFTTELWFQSAYHYLIFRRLHIR